MTDKMTDKMTDFQLVDSIPSARRDRVKTLGRAFKINISPDQQKKATLIKDDTWSKECMFLATKRKYIAIYDNVNKFCS